MPMLRLTVKQDGIKTMQDTVTEHLVHMNT